MVLHHVRLALPHFLQVFLHPLVLLKYLLFHPFLLLSHFTQVPLLVHCLQGFSLLSQLYFTLLLTHHLLDAGGRLVLLSHQILNQAISVFYQVGVVGPGTAIPGFMFHLQRVNGFVFLLLPFVQLLYILLAAFHEPQKSFSLHLFIQFSLRVQDVFYLLEGSSSR